MACRSAISVRHCYTMIMDLTSKKLIAIVGPTASGKTGIGVRLAKELNGEIVSADSRQVYRGLDIGTGKEHFDDVCQRLIDVVEPPRTNVHFQGVHGSKRFSVFDWLPLAQAAIEDIFSRGKVPIVVGGTGLYVQALLEGFHLMPKSKCQILNRLTREQLNNLPVRQAGLTIEQLRAMLSTLYPQGYPQVDVDNPHRLIRAIERAQEGLKPTKIKPSFEALQIGIDLPRSELYKKIDDRVESRFSDGMLEEIIGLIKSGVDVNWLLKLGLEYRIITEFILKNSDSPALPDRINNYESGIKGQKRYRSSQRRELPLPGFSLRSKDIVAIAGKLKQLPEYEAMKQELKYRIHAFARRQLTWFRRFPEIVWLSNYQEIEKTAREFLGS